MTLDELLLEKLNGWRPNDSRSGLTADPGPGSPSVALIADQNDALACRVWELDLNRKAPVEDVSAWARRVADRATGLLEPLRLVEVDGGRNVAQLRSEEPAKRGESVQYYEVLLNGTGEAAVRRFQASREAGAKREQVGFVLTHEALARLTGVLAS
jgi:hypothetical protein